MTFVRLLFVSFLLNVRLSFSLFGWDIASGYYLRKIVNIKQQLFLGFYPTFPNAFILLNMIGPSQEMYEIQYYY